MEPVSLIAAAVTIAMPYLVKSGETFAEKLGEGIWDLVKKPFSKDESAQLSIDNPNDNQIALIKSLLLEKLQNDVSLKTELENAVVSAKSSMNQQNIQNQSTVLKQVNIQTNTGDINL